MIKRSAIIFTRIFLIIILFTVTILGGQVYASDTKTYNLSKYDINILINKDGSSNFEERLTYNFDGQFNGVTRDVDFSNTKGLKDKKIYMVENNGLKELTLNSGKSLDDSGNPGTYNFIEEGNIAHFKIFESSENEEKTFVIKYKLMDVVTKYTDVAEFNRKVIGSEWQTTLDNIKIKITLPTGATKEDLKVFAHGPLQGESSILDGNNVEFTVPSLSSGTFVETLVLFPIKLAPEANNIKHENALPKILANEASLAAQSNKTRESAREYEKWEIQNNIKKEAQRDFKLAQMRSIGNPLSIFFILVWFLIIAYWYRKYDKEFKQDFKGKYYRELPGDYTPAEMSVLMCSGRVNTRDIMATLMDLARKKQVLISPNKIDKNTILGSKETIEYIITLKEKIPTVTLKPHEKFIISWFIIKIGDGNCVSLNEIKSYVKNKYNALKFKADYDKWCKLVLDESAKNNFFYKTSKKAIVFGIIIGFAYFLIGLFVSIFMSVPIAIACIIQGFILIIFSASMKRKTKYGNEQYAMWKAFKNFLKDFSRLDKAEIPSIILWEHFLVYATSLGVAKEVINQLPIVFRDEDLNNNQLTYMHGASYGYFASLGTMFDDTIHTVTSAVSTANSVASSQNSSSSGGGGGFSGGSSGGAGGGGGGGAF